MQLLLAHLLIDHDGPGENFREIIPRAVELYFSFSGQDFAFFCLRQPSDAAGEINFLPQLIERLAEIRKKALFAGYLTGIAFNLRDAFFPGVIINRGNGRAAFIPQELVAFIPQGKDADFAAADFHRIDQTVFCAGIAFFKASFGQ